MENFANCNVQEKENSELQREIGDKAIFRIFFLGKENEEVEVMEVAKIDFEDVKRRLENGESVFISDIRGSKKESRLESNYERKTWFFPLT